MLKAASALSSMALDPCLPGFGLAWDGRHGVSRMYRSRSGVQLGAAAGCGSRPMGLSGVGRDTENVTGRAPGARTCGKVGENSNRWSGSILLTSWGPHAGIIKH